MNIITQSQDLEASKAIDVFAREQIGSALHRFSEDILAVDVFMKDANGPKGGIDKQTLIRIRLRHRHVITLETAHENLYAAIKKGATRAKRAVRRHLRKFHRIRKRRMRDHLNEISIQTVT